MENKNPDEQNVQLLAEALKVNPLISRILVGRGIENFEDAKSYFRPTFLSFTIRG